MSSPYLDLPKRSLIDAERDFAIARARWRLRLIRVDGRPIDPARPFVHSIPAAAATPRQSRCTKPRAAIYGPKAAPGFFARWRRKLRRLR